jgi:hypothetical protein
MFASNRWDVYVLSIEDFLSRQAPGSPCGSGLCARAYSPTASCVAVAQRGSGTPVWKLALRREYYSRSSSSVEQDAILGDLELKALFRVVGVYGHANDMLAAARRYGSAILEQHGRERTAYATGAYANAPAHLEPAIKRRGNLSHEILQDITRDGRERALGGAEGRVWPTAHSYTTTPISTWCNRITVEHQLGVERTRGAGIGFANAPLQTVDQAAVGSRAGNGSDLTGSVRLDYARDVL